MIVAALLAAVALAQDSATSEPAETTLTIEAVGPQPEFASGYLFVTFWVTGRTESGRESKHHVLYMGQPLIPVGARCTLRSGLAQIDYVAGETSNFREPQPAVISYDCGDIHFSA